MPVPKNLIHETWTGTGTGSLTIAAVSGKIRFSDATYGFSTGGTNVFDYFISHRTAAEWEIGTGHMSDANTLVRDTVVFSSNANALVTFSAGTKDVTNDAPASFYSMAQGLIKGRADGAGTGFPTDLTKAQVDDILKPILSRTVQLSTTPLNLTAADSGKLFVNPDTTPRTVNLPTQTSGLSFAFYAHDAAITVVPSAASILLPQGPAASVVVPIFGHLVLGAESVNWEVLSCSFQLSSNTATNAMLSDMAQTTIKGRALAAGTGDPTDLSSTQARDVIGVQYGTKSFWIGARGWNAGTAAAGTFIDGVTGHPWPTFDFDQTGAEGIYTNFAMPGDWDLGTIQCEIHWTANSGSGGVVWLVGAAARGNDDVLGKNNDTSSQFSDTLLATNDLHIVVSGSLALGIGSPSKSDMVSLNLFRFPSDGSDTLNADARLLGTRIIYTVNAGNEN